MNLKSFAFGLGTLLLLAGSARSQNRGSFTGAANYPAGAPVTPTNTGYLQGGISPVDSAKGDFNGDGKMDVVVLASCSSLNFPTCPRENGTVVAVYLNNGDGTFTGPILSGDLNGEPRAIVVGDFDGDGRLDVVEASDCLALDDCSAGTITMLLGDGQGHFNQSGVPQALTGSVNYPGTMAAGHFHDSQFLDLAVGVSCYLSCTSGAVEIFLGNGNGTLGPMTVYSTAGNGAVYPVVGDFDKDGIQDLIVGTFYAPGDTGHAAIEFLKGNGNGSFTAAAPVTLPNYGLTAIAAGDFNFDQNLDLAVTPNGGTLQILNGNGNGIFQAPVTILTGLSNPITNGNTIALLDPDGSGKRDLAISGGFGISQVSGVQILLNDGLGNFTAGPSFPMGGWEQAPIVVADFTGDGKADIVMASTFSELPNHSSDGTISLLFGNGDGSFQGPTILSVPEGPTGIYSAGVADLNGDGIPDLFASNSGIPGQEGIGVLLGSPDGTYQPPFIVPSGVPGPLFTVSGDFNGDGKKDLAVLNTCDVPPSCASASITILIGNGDGTFQASAPYPITGYYGPVGLVMGDFDGDGKPDLAAALECATNDCSQGTVAVLRGNGDGTFQDAKPSSVGPGTVTSIAAADFNSDGLTDVAVTNINSTQADPYGEFVSVLYGNADGSMTIRGTYPSGGSNYGATLGLAVTAADINHDGRPDIVVGNQCEAPAQNDAGCANGSIGVLLQNIDGTFAPVNEIVVTDGNLTAVTLADIDGDGNLDLVGSIADGVIVARGDGNGRFLKPTTYAGLNETGLRSIVVADLNRDGKLDILQPDASGHLAIFYNQLTLNAPNATTTIISAPAITYGASANVTVSANSAQGTVSGNVSLIVDNGAPVTQPLSNGSTTFNIGGLVSGSHSLSASFAAQGNFAASFANSTLQVNKAQPSVTFTGAPATASYNSSFTVSANTNASTTATVSSSGPCSVFGYKVTITSGLGTCNLTANWPADNNYLAASANQSTSATGAVSTVSIVANTPNPAVTGQAIIVAYSVKALIGTPTGNVTVKDGTGDACTATVAAGKCTLIPSTAGAKLLTANYAGDSSFSPSSSPSVMQTVNKAGTVTTITYEALDPSVPAQPVMVKFTVAPLAPGSGAPSGNVTVSDGLGDSCIGTVATGYCMVSFAAYGSKTIVASYAGDANYLSSTSAGVKHNVIDFSISASPASQTVRAGQKTTYTITITPLNGFTGRVALGCTNLAQNSTCSFQSSALTLTTSKPMSTKVTIQTSKSTSPNSYRLLFSGTLGNRVPLAGGILHYSNVVTLVVQ